MRPLRLTELTRPLQARLRGNDDSFSSVATDTRRLAGGELFVALRGATYDGHDFVDLAAEQGAVAAVVSRNAAWPLPCLQVADTTKALGRLAALNREHFRGVLIGITGSSGKTTVKNMLNCIYRAVGPVHATAGNFNNEVGLPLTLLGLTPEHRFAVVEMGASRLGDIAYLMELARPDVAVLLNALPSHLEGFGSLRNVALAKGEIFSGLGAAGVGVVNADSEYYKLWKNLLGERRCISFGRTGADVIALDVVDRGIHGSSFRLCSSQGQADISLALSGQHNVDNALAAAAAALAADAPFHAVIQGLESVTPAPGRLKAGQTRSGAIVIDDSYNANPGSVRAAIDVLVATPGRPVLLLGAMAELGPHSARWHAQIGAYARARGVEELWLVGAAADAARGYGEAARIYADIDSLPALESQFAAGDVVLVKGSRSAGMEAVVSALNPQQGDD